MAKQQKRLAELQDEVTTTEQYIDNLKATDPTAYQEEQEDLNKKLVDSRVEHMEILIDIYKKQNPEKFKAKKVTLEAKVVYLKQGGNPAQWNYPAWAKLQEVAKPVAKAPVKKVEPKKE